MPENIVVVDNQGRIVIPKSIRKSFKTRKFEIEAAGEKIELKPVKSLEELFGSLPLLDLKRIRKEHEKEVKREDFG